MTQITGTIGCTYLGASGTAIGATGAGTNGHMTRVFELRDSGTVQYARAVAPHIQPVGDQQVKASRPTSTSLEFEVLSTTAEAVAGSDDMEELALDEWRDLNALFLPYTGRQHLMVSRKNHANADVKSVSLVEVAELPGARLGSPGVGEFWHTGVIHYPVKCYKPFPFWWNATATATDTADVGAVLVATTVTVPSGAVSKCGARITFKTVTGASTKWLFQNATTGDEFTSLSSDTPHDGDYIDLYHADKLGNTNPFAGMTHSTTFAQNGASENKATFWLVPGANTINITRIAGAGSVTFTITFQELYGSI